MGVQIFGKISVASTSEKKCFLLQYACMHILCTASVIGNDGCKTY